MARRRPSPYALRLSRRDLGRQAASDASEQPMQCHVLTNALQRLPECWQTPNLETQTQQSIVRLIAGDAWTAVNFNGTPEFKRQAWIAAAARGINGVGHTSSDGDRIAAHAERKRIGLEAAPTQAPTGGSITRAHGPDRAAVDVPTAAAAPGRTAPDSQGPDQQGRAPQTAAPAGDAPALIQRPAAGEPQVAQQVRAYLVCLGDTPANVEAIAAVAAPKIPTIAATSGWSPSAT